MMKQFTMILLVIAGLTFLTSCNELWQVTNMVKARVGTISDDHVAKVTLFSRDDAADALYSSVLVVINIAPAHGLNFSPHGQRS